MGTDMDSEKASIDLGSLTSADRAFILNAIAIRTNKLPALLHERSAFVIFVTQFLPFSTQSRHSTNVNT